MKEKGAETRLEIAVGTVTPAIEPIAFSEILHLIQSARQRAYQAVNTELVTLYWQVGEYISRKLASSEWGDGVVDDQFLCGAHCYVAFIRQALSVLGLQER
jgi:hypothetical protein